MVLVITAVVLIVVALIVTTMVGEGLSSFSSKTSEEQDAAGKGVDFAAGKNYCEMVDWDGEYAGTPCSKFKTS